MMSEALLRAVVSSQAVRLEPPEMSTTIIMAILNLPTVDQALLPSLAWESVRLLADKLHQMHTSDVFTIACGVVVVNITLHVQCLQVL